MIDTIKFQNKNFPLRHIKISFEGETFIAPISVYSLEKILMNSNFDNWISKKAQFIDEQIFFYVEDDKIFLKETELKKIIEADIC